MAGQDGANRSQTATFEWRVLLERLCFLYPPVIGVGAIGVVGELGPGVPGLQEALFLVASFGYTLLTLGLAVALYADIRTQRKGGTWEPNPGVYLALAVLLAPLAGVVYLSRRHRVHGTPAGWPHWWLVVAVSLGTTLFGLFAVIIAVVYQLPTLLITAAGLAGAVALGAFPIALYQDAAYVTGKGRRWRPNPGIYLGLAFASLFVPVFQPLLASYYLLERWRTVGLDLE
nr:hypothetical protein [Natronosalvus amylolyticus]